MVGHLLSDLEAAAVFEIRSDAGGAERVAADLGFDAGGQGAPADHAPDVWLQHGPVRQLASAVAAGPEQRPFLVLGDGRRGDVFLEVAVETVMGGISCSLPPFSWRRTKPRRPWTK